MNKIKSKIENIICEDSETDAMFKQRKIEYFKHLTGEKKQQLWEISHKHTNQKKSNKTRNAGKWYFSFFFSKLNK